MTSTHKHHTMSIQYPSHKCLPEKSYLDCLRILIMPWLYNNPVVIMPYCLRTVAWLSFGHVQSKGNQQPKKIKLPKMNFFSRKATNKIFLYLLAPFILQNLKKFLESIQSYETVPFFGLKEPICPEQNIFGTSHYYHFYLPIGPFPFHWAKF